LLFPLDLHLRHIHLITKVNKQSVYEKYIEMISI
jgi:hypothetical protein